MKRTRGKSPDADNLNRQIRKKAFQEEEAGQQDLEIFIPSGSTMLNCACTDNPFGAFRKGRIVTLPGGSASGKTILMLTLLAECNISEFFNHYRLIYDDGEESLHFDLDYLFGNLSLKLEAPETRDGVPMHSETIQDFKGNVFRFADGEDPFIYILDSLDSLSTDEEIEKEYKKAIARAKNPEAIKELTGSYKTEKAKIMGETLRMINNGIKNTDSCLFIVQQERANIGASPFQKQTITSGGLAPFFYSSHQVWLDRSSIITDEINKLVRKTGNKVRANVTKNKINGKLRDVTFDIFYDYGIDDIGSCVDFLIQSGYWEKKKKTIFAKDLDMTGMRKNIITKIEKENAVNELRVITGKAWNEVEEAVKLNRRPRFDQTEEVQENG